MSTPLPRDQFPITERYRYFDHAGVSPLPVVAADAMKAFADRMLTKGKVDYDELDLCIEESRSLAAQLMGVPSRDVAFTKNTTEGLAFVANGLEWAAGDRVVVPDFEFQSMIYPWIALRDRGVQVDFVTPVGPARALPVDEIARVIADGRPPKVVAVSWVQYGRGWRTDLAALARVTHDAGALLCVDVIQGLGILPAAFADWGVDFAASDSQKWLLGPESLGLFYVAERVRDRLRPLEPGWASVAHRYEWDNLELVWDDSARRFEGGSYNMPVTAALRASMELLARAGIDAVWQHVDALCDRLVSGLRELEAVDVLSDRSPEGRSGIVTFSVRDTGADALAARLNERGFVCAPRGGGVRIAPHGYNTIDEIDALVATTADEQYRQTEGH